MDLLRNILFTSLLALSIGCAEPSDEERDPPGAISESVQSLLSVGGTRTTLASITAAENQLITSDGRLFVTGDKGVFELRKNTDGSFSTLTRQGATNCQFGGITEARGVLYVNCYAFTDSYLYAATLSATPTFRQIAMLSGRGLANGLTSDTEGRLYIATTLQNQILRFTTLASDPFTVSVRETWLNNAGPLTNGLKYSGGFIYWSDGPAIKRAAVQSDGKSGPVKQLITELTVFDDLNVDREGILAADFVGGVLRAYDPSGRATAVSTVKFSGPSSVSRPLGRAGFSPTAIVVTERSGNRVSLYEPN